MFFFSGGWKSGAREWTSARLGLLRIETSRSWWAHRRPEHQSTQYRNLYVINSTLYLLPFCFQLQELQLTANQADLDFKSDLADKEELISKLNSELRVLDERLGHQEGAVSEVFEVIVIRVKKPS